MLLRVVVVAGGKRKRERKREDKNTGYGEYNFIIFNFAFNIGGKRKFFFLPSSCSSGAYSISMSVGL